MNNNFDEYFDNDVDGRLVQFIKKFGTSFILTVSALLSVSFYVTAGSAVFGWMPQQWMMITSAIVLGLTGNELAVSFWLSVRGRSKNITETQAAAVGTGIAAGAVTSTLTTMASFIVTPETSPAFLVAYADVIAFVMMSIPVIIQTIAVMIFLAYTREAEVATSKAQAWGEDLRNAISIGMALSKATAFEKQQEIRRQLPDYSRTVGQHGARRLVDKGLDTVRAEGGVPPSPSGSSLAVETHVFPAEVSPAPGVMDIPAPQPVRENSTPVRTERLMQVERENGSGWQKVGQPVSYTQAEKNAENWARSADIRTRVCRADGSVVATFPLS